MLSATHDTSLSTRGKGARSQTIGYYLGAFPCLSETFIQREVDALYRHGLPLHVFAHQPLDRELLQPMGLELLRKTHYLRTSQNPRQHNTMLGRHLIVRILRHPLRTLGMLRYFWAHRQTLFMPRQWKREQLVRVLKLADAAERAGVNHLHSPWAFTEASVALLAAKLLGVPYSVQARASDLYARAQHRGLDQKLAQAAFIITNSNYNVGTIEEHLSDHEAPPIHRVYEGLNLQALDPVEPREGPLGTARLLCVARLTEPKGITHLLQALSLLKRAGRSFTCDIIGAPTRKEPHYAEEVRRLHGELGLEEDVRLLGAQSFEKVLERLRWADLFLLAAVEASDGRRDVTPNSLIEALAMGVPVVSTRSGAIPELVDDGQSGLLVSPGHAEDFAAAICRILDDDALRGRMASHARTVSEDRFDIEKNIQSYLQLFRGESPASGRAPDGRPELASTARTGEPPQAPQLPPHSQAQG